MQSIDHLFITGGTGFFGRSILNKIAKLERSGLTIPPITILTRNPHKFLAHYPTFNNLAWLDFCQGDVCLAHGLPAGRRYSHILHAATESSLNAQLNPLERYTQIVDGTRNILDFAIAHQARRFLLTSSGAVYGLQPSHLLYMPEDWCGSPELSNPDNAYGLGKRSAEHLCALYRQAHDLDYTVARCFAFVGPDLPQDAHYAIGNFIRDALHADSITVAGDGTPIRSYLDQSDLADWLLTLLMDGNTGEVYNVGSDTAISIADLAYLVRDLVAPSKPVHIQGAPQIDADRSIYVPSIRKAKDLHGLAVKVPLADAIIRAAKGRHAYT